MVLTSGGSLLEWWTIANYQILSTKSQDIRCRVSSVRKKKQVSNFGHCDLPFDLAQGGEHVEPFDIWDLLFGIFCHSKFISKGE